MGPSGGKRSDAQSSRSVMPHTIVMVTTSYPRFPGDTVGTFMEPIAQGIADRGHAVHIVAPWHPLVRRSAVEHGVHFHFFRYAPIAVLNVFGYAAGLRADVELRWSAYAAAPFAVAAAWRTARRVARAHHATAMHGHWVVPGGVIAAAAAGSLPLVLSLHGSDVFVAERHVMSRRAAVFAFQRAAWVTACSDDLRRRAVTMGAAPQCIEVLPYGVDADRFSPDLSARARIRRHLRVTDDQPVVFAAGRLVRKKGFGYLLDAAARLVRDWPNLQVVIAGAGDLEEELASRAMALAIDDHVRFIGNLPQDDIPSYLSAADLVVVPSVRDDAGNVDGLPNILLEALASGTAVVTTDVGGINSVAIDDHTAVVVPPADDVVLAMAIDDLLRSRTAP